MALADVRMQVEEQQRFVQSRQGLRDERVSPQNPQTRFPRFRDRCGTWTPKISSIVTAEFIKIQENGQIAKLLKLGRSGMPYLRTFGITTGF
jgi:hypothetical protein